MPNRQPIQTNVTDPKPRSSTRKEELLELLTLIGELVSATLGECCEVVIHDLADLEHSIVSISGDVTGRQVNGPMTDLGLAMLRSGRTEPLLNYRTYTNDGKTLKSSSLFIHDERGKPAVSFCLNLDITPALLTERFLGTLTSEGRVSEVSESFFEDVAEMVETTIAECGYRVGKPISVMMKDDRMKIVGLLDERGVFQLRKSVPLVAGRLGVTEKTVYNYLAELGRRE